MNAIYRMGAVAVLILSLLTPAMACVLPSHQATAAEAACCKLMHGNCSGMEMQASQPCCQMRAHTSQIVVVQPQTTPLLPTYSTGFVIVPAAVRSSAPQPAYRVAESSSHPPPILRI